MQNMDVDDDYEEKNDLVENQIDDDDVIETAVLSLEMSAEDFRNRKNLEKKHYSDVVLIGGHQWRILFFPCGNNEIQNYISYFVEFKDINKLEAKDQVFVSIQFVLLSEFSHIQKENVRVTSHVFNRSGRDWGFQKYAQIDNILDPAKGHMSDSRPLVLTAKVTVCKGTSKHWLDQLPYDSKKMTGFVGLKNQGATCYMNSILQTIYCTNILRRAIFQMPTENDDENSVPLALQRVFYQLQELPDTCGTSELTKSFGWTSLDSFMQHDVQEFSRVLCDHLESKMKNTAVDGIVGELLEGKMKSYIKCINVDYESSRSESFYDIQLNVKGMKNLHESFDDYIQIETLDGDNKYRAEGHGLQDAKKGVIFEKFPPVLHLQLKRFEYDMYRDQMVKINDRHEFPEKINLDGYLEKPGDTPEDYTLQSVLVHAGDLHGGHYVVYIRPKVDGAWLKFDDDRVSIVDAEEAMDGNFGVDSRDGFGGMGGKDQQRNKIKQYTNAYMLVYIRDSKLKEVLDDVTIDEIPQHLRDRFKTEELEEQRRLKEEEEEATFVNIPIVLMNDMKTHHGLGLYDFEKSYPTTLKLKKDSLMNNLYGNIAHKSGIEVKNQRLWKFSNASGGVLRPNIYLDKYECSQQKVSTLVGYSAMDAKIFVEDMSTTKIPDKDLDYYLLVLFKYYNPEKASLELVGYELVHIESKLEEVVPKMLKMAKLEPITRLECYREDFDGAKYIKTSEPIDRVLQNGSVICFQPQAVDNGPNSTVEKHLLKLLRISEITFRPFGECKTNNEDNANVEVTKKKNEEFKLELDGDITYDQVAEAVAEHIKFDQPSHIRFIASSLTDEKPELPIRRLKGVDQKVKKLAQMKDKYNRARKENIFYYEILDTSLVELENKKDLKITIGKDYHKLLMEQTDKVEDVVTKALRLSKIEKPICKYRFLEIFSHQITKNYEFDKLCEDLSDGGEYRLEEIPEDQVTLDTEKEKLVQVCHFNQRSNALHGNPFYFKLLIDEPFSKTKERLRVASGLSETVFSKSRIALVNNTTEYIDDEDLCLFKVDFQENNDFIGIDRPGRSNRFNKTEQAIVFK